MEIHPRLAHLPAAVPSKIFRVHALFPQTLFQQPRFPPGGSLLLPSHVGFPNAELAEDREGQALERQAETLSRGVGVWRSDVHLAAL